MPLLAIIFGLLLDLLGLAGFIAGGGNSFTAFIPAIPGSVLLVCGAVSLAFPGARKHAMHVAALFGLIGALGGLGMGLPKLGKLIAGTAERPLAVQMQIAMGIISLIFLALCVKSFIDARRKKPENYGA